MSFFWAEANGWWEWLVATIITVDPTEFIAVENRSHNLFNQCLKTKRIFVFDQTGSFLGRRLG